MEAPAGTHTQAPTGAAALALLVAGTFFMENLDATVITPAIPAMARGFGVAPVDLNTGVSAYMLTLGVFIPISGWAARRWGARRIFCGAIALFTLASLLCGLAAGLDQFVAMRILQGMGGAMMVPVGRLVVLRETPKTDLVKAIAVLTWPALVAPVLGPPLGGWIADHADWRWIFWLNLPLGALALAMAARLVPKVALRTAARDVQAFDWAGFVLCGGGLFGVMAAAEMISRPRVDWELAGLALGAGGLLLAAGARHLARAAHPMLDPAALKVRTFAVAVWGGSLFRMGVSAVPFLVPLMFQIGFGFDAFHAGMMLMAVFAGNLAIKPLTTRIMRRFGFRRVLLCNGLANAAMIAACALFSAATPLWLMGLILFFGGATRSMQFTALNSIAFADMPDTRMVDANTLFSTAFQLAMGLGIALGALAWRLGGTLVGGGDSATPFRVAFLVVALVALLGMADSLRLPREAGAHVLLRSGR